MKRFFVICMAILMLSLFGACGKERKLSNSKYNTVVREIQTHTELIQKCIEGISELADDNPTHIYINESIIQKEYSDAAKIKLQNTDETLIQLFKEMEGLNGINVYKDRLEFAGWGGLYSTIGFCYCPDHALTIEDLMGVNSAGETTVIDDDVYYWRENDGDNDAFIKKIDQFYYYYEIWF